MGCGEGSQKNKPKREEQYVEKPKQSSHEESKRHSAIKTRDNEIITGEKPTIRSNTGQKNTKKNPKKLKKHVTVANVENIKFDISKFVTEGRDTLFKRYKFISILGNGAYGEVRLMMDTISKEQRAMKVIHKEDIEITETNIHAEIDILKSLDHPNIIKLYEFYQDKENYYLITEYCSGGELFDKIVKQTHFSESKASFILKQVISAVHYCHLKGIVHRDLKPENILLETEKPDSAIKIIDFGTARLFKPDEKMRRRLGTAYYIAPEVLDKNYNEKCDIWSCGVILYILLSGRPPFAGKTDEEIFSRIRRGEYSFSHPEWEVVSESAKLLIRKMLEFKPADRISAAEVLAHPWMSKFTVPRKGEISKMSIVTLRSLKTFNVKAKLQQAVMAYIANNFQSKANQEKLRATFREFDQNGDGVLEKDELISGYMQLGVEKSEAVSLVENIMNTIDINKNGTIDYSEFLMATMNKEELLSQEKLKEAFKLFDKDGNGQITLEEIREVFGSDDETLRVIIGEADKDGDGQISFPEFKGMMIRLYKECV